MSETPDPTVKQESDYPEIDPAVRRASRIKLLTIFGMFAVPLILASIYLHLVRASGGELGSTSRGELIKPAVPLTEFALQQADGDFNLDSVRGSWTMFYMPEGECGETCQLNLYHMRQVRLALNHRMDRVQRVVLAQTDTQVSQELQAEHPGLIVATGDGSAQSNLRQQVQDAVAEMDDLADAIYLIDPFGNVMLRFPPELEPKSMLKDIKHLLKVSRIG